MRKPSFFHVFLITSFLFSANVSAQIGSSANNFSAAAVSSNTSAKDSAALNRPRIIKEKAESSALTAFELEKQAFALLNEQRHAAGLNPLQWNDDVAKIARLHSQNMANQQFFSHAGLDGSMVDDRADDLGISKWRAIGENIAYNRGYPDPVKSVVERWMESVSHRRNLLNKDWQESGVGVAITESGTYYFTQVFLLRK